MNYKIQQDLAMLKKYRAGRKTKNKIDRGNKRGQMLFTKYILNIMKAKRFLKIYSDFHGEKIDHIDQIVQHSFTGRELKKLCEFVIKQDQELTDQEPCKCGKQSCLCYTR